MHEKNIVGAEKCMAQIQHEGTIKGDNSELSQEGMAMLGSIYSIVAQNEDDV